MDNDASSLEKLIGFDTISRRYESLYAFVARLIRSNLLSDGEARRFIPKSWVIKIFAPDDEASPDPGPDFRKYVDSRFSALTKLDIEPWAPFPTLTSVSQRCLRGCQTCLELGHHSYAYQGDLIARCPIHDEPLTHRCPHCQTPLWWRHSTISESAFRCPRGCDLLGGLHMGLEATTLNDLAFFFRRHLALIRRIRSTLRFASSPIYVAYPPRLIDLPIEEQGLPSLGLLPAIVDALRPYGPELPTFEKHHGQSHGAWRIKVTPFPLTNDAPASATESLNLLQAFKRGAFRTELPAPSPLAPALLRKLKDYVMLIEGNPVPRISVASYLVTTGEVAALQRLLAKDNDQGQTQMHYELLLHDILGRGLKRQEERQRPESRPRALGVAESVSAVMRLASGLFRVQGYTATDIVRARDSWKDFAESVDYL
ncbi:hypothetical protein [Dyella sp. Tek66A03]|uniref:hypothetical protein n=1 Tax=Dyella sp. Tek66A03 TaxID=3458298 RepID=UPI00403E92D1